MKLILNTEQERIIFSSLLHTQVECRMIGDDADAIAKYPTLVCMAELTRGVIGDVLDKMLDEEGDEDETI